MMPKYAKYKDSGIERLGEIPEHWKTKRIKIVSKIVNGSTPKSGIDEYWDGDITWVTPADFNGLNGKVFNSGRNITEKGYKSCGTDLVPKGSTILTCRAPIGNSVIAMNDLCTNQGCKSLVPFFIDSRYLYYTIVLSEDELVSLGQGTTFLEISKTKLGNTKLTLPLNSEQTAIVNYLDEKTAKIDKLIKNKQAQIDRLKEIRQIEINNAVTKGLDPNAKLKPSGIEWLGDIPEHWEVKRIKCVAKIVNGSTPKSSVEKYWDGDIIWVTPADFNGLNGQIWQSGRNITDEGYKSCGTELVPDGSTVLTCRAPIGNVVIAKKELCTNQGCKSLVPIFVNSRYLYYLIVNGKDELVSLGQGTTFLELSKTKLGNTKLPLPQNGEQAIIANYLDKKTEKIDKLINNIESQIEKLIEIRKIEIYNAVTGKIKVA